MSTGAADKKKKGQALLVKLQAAKKKPKFFAFAKGSGEHAFDLYKKPANTTQIKELKAEVKATVAFTGLLVWNKEEKVFMVFPEGAASGLEPILIKTVAKLTGKMMPFEVKENADPAVIKQYEDAANAPDEDDENDDDDDDSEDDAESDETPVESGPDPLTAQLEKLKTRYKEAAARGKEAIEKVKGAVDLKPVAPFFKEAAELAKSAESAAPAKAVELYTKALEQIAQGAKTLKGLKPSSGSDSDEPPVSFGPWNAAKFQKAKEAYFSATEEIDAQITKLQAAMRNHEFEELAEFADFGVNFVTGDFKVPLMAVLRDIESVPDADRPKALAKANQILAGFITHILSSEVVEVCDGNPLGVEITVRPVLGKALEQLQNAIIGK